MTIDQLISELNAIKEQHGNVIVNVMEDHLIWVPVNEVSFDPECEDVLLKPSNVFSRE